ncbi:DASH complex subunit Dad1 [Ceraceosorus bombacis]|uniref:DASH complex subunit DAD1 n=2 Tax=Ceraceosorus TaxID=401624 RepID=A0A0P1BGT8_9BASI|nr:hypothetical protein IE81DRAFT_325627 [Ceraceosorus guamensis]PWN40394.1 hypothetical protein IE81DRAFT_325627 [Ceraceosorus guamensis]CEH14948.1 DASH complex subunit Dad1 [Ceraceosorus bombacis]
MEADSPVQASHPTAGSSQKSFFEKERERLVVEIAEGIGTIIDHSNALNRKLEESISVGKEFEPIAGLWGRFTEVMRAAGIPDLSGASTGGAGSGVGEDGGADNQDGTAGNAQQDGLSRSQGADTALPPGVAPGGGIVYGRDA